MIFQLINSTKFSMRVEVFKWIKIQAADFWVVTPCSKGTGSVIL